MRVILKTGILVFAAETEDERAQFAAWSETTRGHVFYFDGGSAKGGALRDLGPREEACREPINIVYDIEEQWLPISNLAETPFTLRDKTYASIEGFWQGLKYPLEEDRRRVAALSGRDAKFAAPKGPTPATFSYDGRTYVAGSANHRALMLQACRAKFTQHLPAQKALLSTGERPLTHRVRRDSKTIPGALMAEIWMRVRSWLKNRETGAS
ncbi:NADAR family protein [Methylocystis bryophila]|uniref:Uncharacterized protein n=1 Tax=Methylocystis bryophila TaxID=655015 RepID=A0A1W6MZT8_9HYPH|nr:NADAR family protein [Methylocystis bryophila]ARN83085.1 hypothetical protein B1812_20615 [Methylocystis bryophila]BDV39400.1 hypothetical protein DSM21852_26530 [Methylocystis bryophila]